MSNKKPLTVKARRELMLISFEKCNLVGFPFKDLIRLINLIFIYLDKLKTIGNPIPPNKTKMAMMK